MCYWNRKCYAKLRFGGLLGSWERRTVFFSWFDQFGGRTRRCSSFGSWAQALAKLAVTNEFSSFALAHRITNSHPLCSMSIKPPILRYSYFKIWPWKSLVKAMRVVKGQGHIWPWKFIPPSILKIQRSRSWPRSNPLVTFEAWSSIDTFAFRFEAIGPLLVESEQIPYLTLKIQGQGHGQGQTWWSHLRHWVQSICLLFVSWQSDNFWLRYSKFHIWPWKFKVKVLAKVKPDGDIWGLGFNRYVCFSFRGNRTIFGWDIANCIFDLENSRSKSQQKLTKF